MKMTTISDISLHHDSGSCDYWIVELSDGRFAFVWGNFKVVEGEPLTWDRLGGVRLTRLEEIESASTDERGISFHDSFGSAAEAWKDCAAAVDQCRRDDDPAAGTMWQVAVDAGTERALSDLAW